MGSALFATPGPLRVLEGACWTL